MTTANLNVSTVLNCNGQMTQKRLLEVNRCISESMLCRIVHAIIGIMLYEYRFNKTEIQRETQERKKEPLNHICALVVSNYKYIRTVLLNVLNQN